MKLSILMLTALLGTAATTETQAQTPQHAPAAAGRHAHAVPAGDMQKQTVVGGVQVGDLRLARNGEYMAVDMTMDIAGLDIETNRAVLLTPRLVNGADSIDLPSIGIYGRRRYYYYVRNGESMLSGPEETTYRASQRPDSVAYSRLVPYRAWMNGADLALYRSDWGCCNTIVDEQRGLLGFYSEFFPTLVYMQPQGETVKQRHIEGSAYIDFVVDRTEIKRDYHNNEAELNKIVGTIEPLRSDSDITVTQVWLKGYASPESPYRHNRDLARGRVASVKGYVQNLYSFPENVIVTEYEPEDWAGLRRYVDRSNLAHRAEILALIDSDMEPDAKEARIRRLYPQDYRFLLQNSYPYLRHTDYRIAYTIRSYSDVEEIKRVMRSRPQNLSLNEFYLVAQEYEPGTDEFAEVFETAVRMYPDDEAANLNAANAAMRRGDLDGAERYLTKAGKSPEAVYARGALAIRRDDYATARRYLTEARDAGLKQAAETLRQMR